MKKLNKDIILSKLKTIPAALKIQAQNAQARWRALPVEQRKNVIKSVMLFVSGVLVGILVTLGLTRVGGGGDDSAANSASAVASANATDWGELVGGLCQTHSPVNLLAMKLDFPFSCMRDNGQIDKSCVQKDLSRFAPNLPQPYQQNLGVLEARLGAAEDGSAVMNYYIPLKNASFQQLPLTALAVNIATKPNATTPLGWQTPHLVIQGDYSTIQSVLAQYAPAPQTVYYANIPAKSDALPGPFATLDEARIATRKAGGRTSLIKKQQVALQANFLEGVNEVALSCVPQAAK